MSFSFVLTMSEDMLVLNSTSLLYCSVLALIVAISLLVGMCIWPLITSKSPFLSKKTFLRNCSDRAPLVDACALKKRLILKAINLTLNPKG